MNTRPIQEEDIPHVINLFRTNYGDDYAIPEFYDPQWVKRGIYSDNIIWLVIEDEGKIVASGACILNFGDYNDQIGEIGRLVVDPQVGGKGLGRAILAALVDASDDRVEFAFGEARTTHPKTQKIFDRVGLMPLGFLPMYYLMGWRESWVLSGQLFGNGRRLRRIGQAEVIPVVAPLAQLSMKNLELDEPFTVRDNARAYPMDHALHVEPLTGASLVRLLQIEHGRLIEPEVFGSMHIDQGMPQLQSKRAHYLVASDGERTLGAVGYHLEEHDGNVRITELIAQDDSVKGGLLRLAVEKAESELEANLIEIDVSAYSPRIQQTLFEMGFLPTGYVPGMVFHNTNRWDVVKMAKINLPWELGKIELTEPSQSYFDLVSPAFQHAADARARKRPAASATLLSGLTPLEIEFFHRECIESTPAPNTTLDTNSLHIVIEGTVKTKNETHGAGSTVGMNALLGGESLPVIAGEDARVLTLDAGGLTRLGERHPRLAVKLYKNFAAAR